MPPKSNKPVTGGRWRAIALSLLVHSAIVAAAVLGWFTWKHEPPAPDTLAIQATVVDEHVLKGIATAPKPAPPEPVAEKEPEPVPEPEPEPAPAPPEEQGPPAPDPAEIEKRREAERLAAEKVEQEKQAQEQQRLDAEMKEAERLEEQKQAAAKAAADKATAEKAAAEKKAAEKKRAEEAAAARKAAEEKARLAAQEELRRSMEAEERGNAARNSDEAARWHAQIIARVTRAWIRPPSFTTGVSCTVLVKQVPGGEVTDVQVESCTVNNAALRQSVENAVLAASPLPPPPAGVPFERNLRLIFAPQ
jgi:colicin import membrane protein